MPRQYCIFPAAGWTLSAPYIADPLMNVPFIVKIPYWKISDDTLNFRFVNFGVMWDDNVAGAGGLSHELFQVLELTWQAVKQDFSRLNLLVEPLDLILTDARSVFTYKNMKAVDIEFLQVPTGIDYWWGTEDFGKYGFVAPVTGDNHHQTQTFVNFLRQRIVFQDLVDGVDIFIQGGAILCLAKLWKGYEPPALEVTIGYSGFTGSYDDEGWHDAP